MRCWSRYGPDATVLCTTDLDTNVTTPLLASYPDYPRAYDSLEVIFFENAVLYTSAGGTVAEGDPVACIIEDPNAGGKSTCHWVNDVIQSKADYAYTKIYTNYHIPSNPDGVHQWAIWKDVLIYRTCTCLLLPAVACVGVGCRLLMRSFVLTYTQTRRCSPTPTSATT